MAAAGDRPCLGRRPNRHFSHFRRRPALDSQIIIVMLGSAVCGQISTSELLFAANLIQGRNFRAFEAFSVVSAIYLLLSIACVGDAAVNAAARRDHLGARAGTGR